MSHQQPFHPGYLVRDTVSARLAAMSVGESYVSTNWTRPWRLCVTDKRNARRRMDDPEAQWAVRSTNKGIRITRVR